MEFEKISDAKEKVIRVSRERYARPRAEVEEKISRWSGVGVDDGDGASAGDGKLQESICWNCGKTATVPFKPDGKRPVYCLSCLRQIEDGKLVPLPDRMPKVGKARFDDTLGAIGIEFSSGSQASVPVERP
ncbi:MAG: CxxC-x17-CxxC domain-containing protein, partial [Patescibacteria group bacterium]